MNVDCKLTRSSGVVPQACLFKMKFRKLLNMPYEAVEPQLQTSTFWEHFHIFGAKGGCCSHYGIRPQLRTQPRSVPKGKPIQGELLKAPQYAIRSCWIMRRKHNHFYNLKVIFTSVEPWGCRSHYGIRQQLRSELWSGPENKPIQRELPGATFGVRFFCSKILENHRIL